MQCQQIGSLGAGPIRARRAPLEPGRCQAGWHLVAQPATDDIPRRQWYRQEMRVAERRRPARRESTAIFADQHDVSIGDVAKLACSVRKPDLERHQLEAVGDALDRAVSADRLPSAIDLGHFKGHSLVDRLAVRFAMGWSASAGFGPA
jgi:hypothetical protein